MHDPEQVNPSVEGCQSKEPQASTGSQLMHGIRNDPETHSVMSEWKFDSASVVRLQLNHETPRANIVDNQMKVS